MKYLLIVHLFVLINISLIGQNPSFYYTRPLLQNIDSIETSSGGILQHYNYRISVDSNYFPNASSFDLENPLVFITKYSRFFIEKSYFFTKNDSIIRLVQYNWEFNQSTITNLDKIFKKNRKSISKHFNSKGKYIKEAFEDDIRPWTRDSVIWENSETYICLFKLKGSSTNRVRVLISYK